MLSTRFCFGFIIAVSTMFFCLCNGRDTLIDVNSGNDLISFDSDRSGNDEIYIMDINSHNIRQLTSNTVADYWPSWSQDGEWIAYSSVQDGNWDIYMVNLDGTKRERLTRHAAKDVEPAWSPDGKKIAFISERDHNPEIYIMNADGQGIVRLTNNIAVDVFMHWSPDCRKIVFCSNRDGNFEIYCIDADGNNQMRLTHNNSNDWTPKWFPDGKKIAFVAERDGNAEIYIMSPDGKSQRNVTHHPGIDYEPDWSPDGSKIVFVSDRSGNQDIYLAELTEDCRMIDIKQLTTDPDSDRHPSWRPNKKAEFRLLKGPYLGQKPPGMTPELFAPGIISREDTREFAITFSPDGRECFFTRSLTDNFIMATKEVNGKWTDPDVADFSGKNFDFLPLITPNGSRLIFGSNRPLPQSEKAIGYPQFYCEKDANGWSPPKPLGSPFKDRFVMCVSVTNDGTIYFTGNENGKDGIYMSKWRDGQYQDPVDLGENIDYLPYSAHPFISPDESYLIYDAQPQEGNADLFISFKKKDGTWTKSVSLGEKFNTDWNDMCAFVSRDGEYLFFSRLKPGKGDIYWVDAKIIEELKPDG